MRSLITASFILSVFLSFAQDKRFEIGYNILETGEIHSLRNLDVMTEADQNYGLRAKYHIGSAAVRLGFESKSSVYDFTRLNSLVMSTTSERGLVENDQIEFNLGLQYEFGFKIIKAFGFFDLGYLHGTSKGNYHWVGCFGAGGGDIDNTHRSISVSPGCGLQIRPLEFVSINIESRFQLNWWKVKNDDQYYYGYGVYELYPSTVLIPFSTFSINYHFGL